MLVVDGSIRPPLLTVATVVGMGFGVIGTAFAPLGLAVYFVKFGRPNPVVDIVRSDSFLFAWTIGSQLLGILLSLTLAVGSFLAFRLRPIGRTLLIVYGIAGITTAAMAMLINALVLMPRLIEAAKSSSNPIVMGGAIGGAIGGGIGGMMGMILPILMLIVMWRPEVKRALASTSGVTNPIA
jgi:hypothetical protein